ncbi:hypothetical protein G7059_04475 [Erysipelothrix sp. HDW6A]|uniref:hypothetical protein n=1 Tax=Erysipelothrix sp. HDW6A TaxID=2714928 RepID=UPI001407DAFC|nr:hypothetical protein [Erysipelothrix sp. HDW6A]QIK57155.1 hypothetical protein G7059_04475 [Erysipelothrix sp. HDW6A]
MQKYYKKYIDVVVHVNQFGDMMPLFIVFDNVKYPIDKVLQIRNAASQVGGAGILYECRIQNQVRKLFFERTRWFIESYHP